MRSSTATPKLIATTGALIIAVGHSLGSLWAQESSAKDNYQRSLQIYEFKKAAPSGPARGQEIFYYKPGARLKLRG